MESVEQEDQEMINMPSAESQESYPSDDSHPIYNHLDAHRDQQIHLINNTLLLVLFICFIGVALEWF